MCVICTCITLYLSTSRIYFTHVCLNESTVINFEVPKGLFGLNFVGGETHEKGQLSFVVYCSSVA